MKLRYFEFALLLAPLIAPLSTCSPRVGLSPSSLTFSPQVVTTTSGAKTVTLTNSGLAGLSIGSIVSSGYYSQSNDCPALLGIHATCTINVKFVPKEFGTINGAITITDNAPGSPQVVSLSGTSITPVAFSPGALSFGTIPVGTTSVAKAVSLTNHQSTGITISTISTSGDYFQRNNCPASLGAGASCTISVSHHPTVVGSNPGVLSVSTNAFPGTQPVGLSGSGSGAVTSHVAFSPASLAFGNQEAGLSSNVKSVILTNKSTTTSLTITSVAASGPNYLAASNCVGKMIPGGGTCTISVTFHPTAKFAPVSYPGAVTVFDSDSTTPQMFALSGTGVPPVTASPGTLNYGTVVVLTHSAAKSVTLTNHHNTAETLSTSVSGEYAVSNNGCTSPVPAGGKCSLGVTFSPVFVGTIKGAVTIRPSSDGFLSPQVVSLSGCSTGANLSPLSLNFGSEPVGMMKGPLTATLTNESTDLNITGISITGDNGSNFAISNNTCGSLLPAGQSCTVDVTFTPTATGIRTGVLNISDNAACGGVQRANLTGTGT